MFPSKKFEKKGERKKIKKYINFKSINYFLFITLSTFHLFNSII